MKRHFKLFVGTAVVLVALTAVAGYWFFHVPLDEARVQAILKEVSDSFPESTVSPEEQQRIFDNFKNVADRFEAIETGGSVDQKLLQDYQQAISDLLTIPLVSEDSLLKGPKLSPITLLDTQRLILKKCSELSLEDHFHLIESLFKKQLQLAEKLMRPPTHTISFFSGRKLYQEVIAWKAQFPPLGKLGHGQILPEGGAHFADLVHYEMLYADTAYHSLRVEKLSQGSAIGNFMARLFNRDWKLTMKYHLAVLDQLARKQDPDRTAQALTTLYEEQVSLPLAPLSKLIAVNWGRHYLRFIEDDETLPLVADLIASLTQNAQKGPEDAGEEDLEKLEELEEVAPPPSPPPPKIVTLLQGPPAQVLKKEVAQQRLDQSLEKLDELYTQVRIVPHFSGGRQRGLKILSLQAGSLFEEIGFAQGDIILSVNDMELDLKTSMEIFEKLKNVLDLKFLMIRGNELVQLNLHIQST